MDLGQSKSIKPLSSSMESQARPIKKNNLRCRRKFLRKRFSISVRSRRLHRTAGIGLLRAAILGANDGILSTSSLSLGAAAACGFVVLCQVYFFSVPLTGVSISSACMWPALRYRGPNHALLMQTAGQGRNNP
jgi:hypothetical protein